MYLLRLGMTTFPIEDFPFSLSSIRKVYHKRGFENGRSDVEFCLEQEMNFHSKIYEITGNALIMRIGNVINDLFRQGIAKTLEKEGAQSCCIENHYRIYNSIRMRDKAALRVAVQDSLEEWRLRKD